MINTFRLKSIYTKIQNQLFYIIPEKWDRIYLYASIVEKVNHIEIGEMFFYYYPKGLLKKNPVNVYEVPYKFNIDENNYMNLVDKLYDSIKLLRREFEKSGEKLWSNLTISIENLNFRVEYNYEDLFTSIYSNYDRHIIWQYKYLKLPIERLVKKDREMLQKFLLENKNNNKETKEYTEIIYRNKVHNVIEYEKEKIGGNEIYTNRTKVQNKLDKYELYKIEKQISNSIEKQEVRKVNQILNF